MPTIYKRFCDAVSTLAGDHDITLILSSGTSTRADAYTDAVEHYGVKLAVIHLEDGQWGGHRPRRRDLFRDRAWHDVKVLMVDYPWNDATVGGLVRDVLVSAGFTVEWNGDGTQALEIVLEI